MLVATVFGITATVVCIIAVFGWRFWIAYPAYLQALRDRARLERERIDAEQAQLAATRAALAPYVAVDRAAHAAAMGSKKC